MTTFDSVLAQYEKNKQAASGNNNRVSQEDRLKKYFTTLLPKVREAVKKEFVSSQLPMGQAHLLKCTSTKFKWMEIGLNYTTQNKKVSVHL